jgi:hypothetical protein
MTPARQELQNQIAEILGDQNLPGRLPTRIARQLMVKCAINQLDDTAVWRAMGQQLHREVKQLRTGIGLVDRQIVVALPKLSPSQIEALLDELLTADSRIARTILNAALDASTPGATARRYLDEFHHVTDELKTINPEIARTVANGTFMASVPHAKAMAHLKAFVELVGRFKHDVMFARTVAKEAFRAKDPVKAVECFIANFERIVAELTSKGTQPQVARTIAAIACISGDPVATSYRLLQNFEDVLRLANKTHPWVARSIALSACRAANPLSTARLYMSNYDNIVRLVSVTQPNRARKVASQVFRSDDPVQWARRYLAKTQTLARP